MTDPGRRRWCRRAGAAISLGGLIAGGCESGSSNAPASATALDGAGEVHPTDASLSPGAPDAPRSALAGRVLARFGDANAAELDAMLASWPVAAQTVPTPALERVDSPCWWDARVSDGYRYIAWIDPAGERFWFQVCGGIAGINEFRGPASFDDARAPGTSALVLPVLRQDHAQGP